MQQRRAQIKRGWDMCEFWHAWRLMCKVDRKIGLAICVCGCVQVRNGLFVWWQTRDLVRLVGEIDIAFSSAVEILVAGGRRACCSRIERFGRWWKRVWLDRGRHGRVAGYYPTKAHP